MKHIQTEKPNRAKRETLIDESFADQLRERTGIYCFICIETELVLYVGKALDALRRIRKHMGALFKGQSVIIEFHDYTDLVNSFSVKDGLSVLSHLEELFIRKMNPVLNKQRRQFSYERFMKLPDRFRQEMILKRPSLLSK